MSERSTAMSVRREHRYLIDRETAAGVRTAIKRLTFAPDGRCWRALDAVAGGRR